MAEAGADAAPDGATGRRPRPLLVVAIGAALVAVGHSIWIWQHRRLGALDPDEAGYIATAMRYERTFSLLHPGEFVRAVGGTGFGPLVPLASVPMLWLGPDDARTVLLSQPLMMVIAAVIVAGITRRLAGDAAAVVTGLAFAVLPTVAMASQTYWFGLGAAIGVGVALWGLVASEGCRTRTTWWFGVGLAVMVLARTMTLGYVPGLFGAAIVMAGRDRLAWRRVAQATGIAVVVAGPWYVVEWPTIYGYLSNYGYGSTAAIYGSGGPFERLGYRIDRIADAIGPSVVVSALVVGAVGAATAVARRRARSAPGVPWREVGGLAVAAALGLAALVSTTNSGVWFELPLVVMLLPLGAVLVGAAPRPLPWLVVAPVVGMAIVQSAVVWWWIPPTSPGVPWLAKSYITSSQQEPGFAEYDRRFATERRGSEVVAAREWWQVTERVSRIVDRIAAEDGAVEFWMSGSMTMFNTNTLTLHGEIRGRERAFHIPETRRPAAERRRYLTPTVRDDDGVRRERVLILAVHDRILFPPDMEVASFARQAEAAGWRVTDRVPMPRGGEVRVLRAGR